MPIAAFSRVLITPRPGGGLAAPEPDNDEQRERYGVANALTEAMAARQKYWYQPEVPDHANEALLEFQEAMNKEPFVYRPAPHASAVRAKNIGFKWSEDGVVQITEGGKVLDGGRYAQADLETFCADLGKLWKTSQKKESYSFVTRRLAMLESNYNFHTLLNLGYELEETRRNSADFLTVTKVDNHVHAASACSCAEMLNFLKVKTEKEADTVVIGDNTRAVTMAEAVFAAAGTTDFSKISTERLDMAASAKMFCRFDNFNDSYNPFGNGDLRSVCMKTNNKIGGRYFAEILRDTVFERVRKQHNKVAIEPRVSVYGRKSTEWADLARWFVTHRMLACEEGGGRGPSTGNVRWMVQIPRLCNLFMGSSYHSFHELLSNIFTPMFEATLHPEDNEDLFVFLCHVGAIDCVDDESKLDPLLAVAPAAGGAVRPAAWTAKDNPPYSYWMYHLNANLFVLNRLRESLGLNTIRLKPHCGESGPTHHLATGYLLADSINHGIQLAKEPVLQYLYYLDQVGMALCPLSNDALFLKLGDSPVGQFMRRGLRVTLGTDDPLQFHNTQSPLVEEYVISSKTFSWSSVDLSEVARNSVLTSAFEHKWKAKWLGENYYKHDPAEANDEDRSNLGPIRPTFRYEELLRELNYLATYADLDADAEGYAALGGTRSQPHRVPVGTRHMLNRLTLAYKQYRDRYNTETERAHKHPALARTSSMVDVLAEAVSLAKSWAQRLGYESLADVNLAIGNGVAGECVHAAECWHNQRLYKVAERVHDQHKKLVFVAGACSAGKTSFCTQLLMQLRCLGQPGLLLSTADYAHTSTARSTGCGVVGENGRFDVARLAEDLRALYDGKIVDVPIFNETSGRPEEVGRRLRLAKGGIIIMEGEFCLDPVITAQLSRACVGLLGTQVLRILVAPATPLLGADGAVVPEHHVRALRTISRDHQRKGASLQQTLDKWVVSMEREEETLHPYVGLADVVFNSSLVYELSVLKASVAPLLTEHRHSMLKGGAHLARALEALLATTRELAADVVPTTSLLTDFIRTECGVFEAVVE